MRVIFTLMLVLAAMGVNAQVTTSAISGKVTDEQNETVIGATVIAIHEPSGTQYGAVTNVDGRYTMQGMRTGGPYKLTVSYVGYQSAAFTGIMLELGNTYTQNVKLTPSSELLDEVVVVAEAKAAAGAGQNFSLGKIENTPTVDRNVYDIVKNMPFAMPSKIGGMTFAGSNNRYNSFQIDGTVSNDVFGLASSGTNGGQTGANPISMDAIQEIQVVVEHPSTFARADSQAVASTPSPSRVRTPRKVLLIPTSTTSSCTASTAPYATMPRANSDSNTHAPSAVRWEAQS